MVYFTQQKLPTSVDPCHIFQLLRLIYNFVLYCELSITPIKYIFTLDLGLVRVIRALPR